MDPDADTTAAIQTETLYMLLAHICIYHSKTCSLMILNVQEVDIRVDTWPDTRMFLVNISLF